MCKFFQQSAFAIFGFTAGILFLMSCGGGGSSSSSSLVNTASAALPDINDQMLCTGVFPSDIGREDILDVRCMKQSTGVSEQTNLKAIYADSWVLIQISDTRGNAIFYK